MNASDDGSFQLQLKSGGLLKPLLALLAIWLSMATLQADQIGDMVQANWKEQAMRFLSLKDPAVRAALIGSATLGALCGALGSFIVVRRWALLGDTLSHAALPGVALGFLWSMKKDPWTIFIGATIAGIAGAALASLIRKTTKLKEDSALGMTLASFFALGIVLISMTQHLPNADKSGLEQFLFGQAAAMNDDDIRLILIAAVVVLSGLILFYKELLLTSFDPGFAKSTGAPVQIAQYGLTLALSFSIVVSLQAVGVALVSALLITPASAAYLLTDRMKSMVWMSALFGALAGVAGAFSSFLQTKAPTGPFIVIGATMIFALAFVLGPKHGWAPRRWRRWSQSQKIRSENLLKAIYQTLEFEDGHVSDSGAPITQIRSRKRIAEKKLRKELRSLQSSGLITQVGTGERLEIFFTPKGKRHAMEIVRNHRLWELYLTNSANFPADHVHDDAERIEHLLGEDMVRRLEKLLNHATQDPHGRPIPTLDDLEQSRSDSDFENTKSTAGYRQI